MVNSKLWLWDSKYVVILPPTGYVEARMRIVNFTVKSTWSMQFYLERPNSRIRRGDTCERGVFLGRQPRGM